MLGPLLPWRFAALVGVLGSSVATLAPGCRAATEVTLDVSVNAQCSEVHGTALTVGVDPAETEQRLALGSVNTVTRTCEAGHVGTLVMTPGSTGRAAVVVAVAFGTQTDPTRCVPPDFKGCVVARRQFSFVDHEGLTLPITISKDCLDVPCDAFTTCRSGRCFPSEVACGGGTCVEPGALVDGGTSLDAGGG